MALVLILLLYAATIGALGYISGFEMSNEVRLGFHIGAAFVGLLLPIVLYSAIAFWLDKRAARRIGMRWCEANAATFLRVEMHKNHYTLVCSSSGKKMRRKFVVRFLLSTWIVRNVEWLEK